MAEDRSNAFVSSHRQLDSIVGTLREFQGIPDHLILSNGVTRSRLNKDQGAVDTEVALDYESKVFNTVGPSVI